MEPKKSSSSESSTNEERTIILEVCIDNIVSGLAAQEGGAKRIELCSALSEGGLTPSLGFLKIMKKLVSIPIFVMIRPRGGDFTYTDSEILVMKEDIRAFRESGADGFVFGVLTDENQVDEEKCLELMKETGCLPVTFHRAFDLTINPIQALETIVKLGFKRILTSGQSSTAYLGRELIRKMVQLSKSRITIMAGAGVTPENANELVKFTNVQEVHGSCRGPGIPPVKRAKTSSSVRMGNSADEMNIPVTDANVVRSLIENMVK